MLEVREVNPTDPTQFIFVYDGHLPLHWLGVIIFCTICTQLVPVDTECACAFSSVVSDAEDIANMY